MRSIYTYYGVYVSFYETYNLVSGNPAKFLQPTAHFSTFGFALHANQPFANPKELKFFCRTDKYFSTDFRGWLKITDSPQE